MPNNVTHSSKPNDHVTLNLNDYLRIKTPTLASQIFMFFNDHCSVNT